jgi:cell shape-determining protein MreC
MKKFSSTMKANSRRTLQNKRISQVVIAGCALVLLLWLLPFAMHVTASLIMAPINGVKTWLAESSSILPQYIRNRTVLVEEIEDLEQQIADRGGDRFTVDMLAKENAELRSLLGDEGDERILAGVIGRPPSLPYDMLMIDQGERDGIVVGAPVYIGDRTIIGFVQSVTSRTSLVTLITTQNFASTVYVLGPDIFTSAVGMGGGQLKVGIPQGVIVEVGDLVILPSMTSGVYGSVSYIETIPTQPEQYAYVSPKTAIGSLRLVSVGKTPMVGATFDAALKNVSVAYNELFTVPVPPEYVASTTNPVASSTATSTDVRE